MNDYLSRRKKFFQVPLICALGVMPEVVRTGTW